MPKVRTRHLRDGDQVMVESAVVRLEGKPERCEAPGRHRVVYWWPNMPIVSGALSWAPQATRLTVQGLGSRVWHVVKRGGR